MGVWFHRCPVLGNKGGRSFPGSSREGRNLHLVGELLLRVKLM
jgi:hypothetical protein